MERIAEGSPRLRARIAGVFYLITFVAGVFALVSAMALFEVIFALWLLIKGVAPYPSQPVRSIQAPIVE